jgi:hypothetical protein
VRYALSVANAQLKHAQLAQKLVVCRAFLSAIIVGEDTRELLETSENLFAIVNTVGMPYGLSPDGK